MVFSKKIYGRMIIKSVKATTENQMEDEKIGFVKGRFSHLEYSPKNISRCITK